VSDHSGNKYHRKLVSCQSRLHVIADVYSVISAYDVKCPATQHAIKKLLCAGLRGKGDRLQDLTEARDAITRAIAMEDTNMEEADD